MRRLWQSCYVPTGLPTAPTFEIFTSSTEVSNQKLLSRNAFPELTVSQKFVELCCNEPLEELTVLPKISLLDLTRPLREGERKRKTVVKNWGERKEGKKGEGKVEGIRETGQE